MIKHGNWEYDLHAKLVNHGKSPNFWNFPRHVSRVSACLPMSSLGQLQCCWASSPSVAAMVLCSTPGIEWQEWRVPSAKTLEINQQNGGFAKNKILFHYQTWNFNQQTCGCGWSKILILTINHGFSTNKHWDVPEEVGSLLSKIGDLIKAAKCTNHY